MIASQHNQPPIQRERASQIMRIVSENSLFKMSLCSVYGLLAVMFLTAGTAAAEHDRDALVLTSTNTSNNDLIVFRLDTD